MAGKGDQITPNVVMPLADTAWAVVDGFGDRFEIKFEKAGTVTSRRIINHWIGTDRSRRAPFVMSAYKFEVGREGRWKQLGAVVEFTLEKDQDNKMAESLHPVFAYVGNLSARRINGTMKSGIYGVHPWAAVLVQDLANRNDGPPILLIGKKPSLPTPDSPGGSITLLLKISATGETEEITVVKTSAPSFVAITKQTLTQWRFLPAVKNGRPVAKSVEMTFNFDAAKWEK